MNKEHKNYLDALRKFGTTNMFGSHPYLMGAFPELNNKDAKAIVAEWMRTF